MHLHNTNMYAYMFHTRSSLIHFACIGVAFPRLGKSWREDKFYSKISSVVLLTKPGMFSALSCRIVIGIYVTSLYNSNSKNCNSIVRLIVLTFESGHDITILKVAIFDKIVLLILNQYQSTVL